MIYEDGQGESCCERHCEVVTVCENECAATANFSYTQVATFPSPTFDFFDLSYGTGTICKYKWDFGDGTPPLILGPYSTLQKSFAVPGPWYVCLTVTNCIVNASGVLVECTNTKCMWVYPSEGMTAPPSSGTPALGGQSQPAQALPLPGSTIIGELDNGKVLTAYPNPSAGSFTLTLNKRVGTYNVVVRDIQGRDVYNREQLFNNTPVKIDLGDIANGIYSVEVVNNTEKFVQQISVTR